MSEPSRPPRRHPMNPDDDFCVAASKSCTAAWRARALGSLTRKPVAKDAGPDTQLRDHHPCPPIHALTIRASSCAHPFTR